MKIQRYSVNYGYDEHPLGRDDQGTWVLLEDVKKALEEARKNRAIWRGTIEYLVSEGPDFLTDIAQIALIKGPTSIRVDQSGTKFFTCRFHCNQAAWDRLQAEGDRFTAELDSEEQHE